MKLACADFSFPLLPHEDSVRLVSMLGVEGIDVALMGNRSHLRPEAIRGDLGGTARLLDERVRGVGLEFADMFVIPWSDFETMAPNHPDAKVREDAAALFRDMLELTVAVGAPGMTMLPGIDWPGESHEESLARSAQELGWRVEQARAAGVRFSIEPHVGSVVQAPAEAKRLVDMTPGLELTLDLTHFVFQGMAASEADVLVPHARHTHLRGAANGRLQTTLRANEIDYGRFVELLRASDYDGYAGIEYVWTPGEPPGGPYDLTNTDNVAETILMRDLVRERLREPSTAMTA